MFKHIVMWKLKDDGDVNLIERNAEIIKSSLSSLPSVIPEISKYEIGVNQTESERAFNVVLISEFNSREDFHTYRDHPKHVEAVEIIRELAELTNVVDYTT